MKPTRALAAVVLVAALLSGCGDDAGGGADPDAAEPTGTVDHSSAESILAAYGLDGMEPAALVDHLDRLPPDDRPEGLQVSVRPARLLVSAGEEEHPLPLPKDSFYVSVAPWVEQTHDCTWHALTSCLGEMQAELDAMHDRLVVGVSSLVDGEQWRAWLRVAAKFRTYSFNNTILLFQQRPDATRVAVLPPTITGAKFTVFEAIVFHE